MRDHGRTLGGFFIGWALVQLVAASVLATQAPSGNRPAALFWLFTGLMAVAYGWVGLRLRAHDSRARVPAMILAAVALLSFPVGTALGGYGLWALIKRKIAAASH